VEETDVIKITDMLSEEGTSKETISSFLTVLQPFFGWYMLRKGVNKDEIARIISFCKSKHVKGSGEHAYPALTPVQQDELFSSLHNPYLRGMAWAGISYGLRAQEVANLLAKDIHINESGFNDLGERDWGSIVIRHSKGNKTRSVYMLPEHVPVWKSILRQREVDEVTFPNVFYWAYTPFTEKGYSAFFSAHISSQVSFKTSSHSMRRTFATNLYRRGVDLVVIQNLLGHETLDVTRKYLNILGRETQQRYLGFMNRNMQ